MTILIILIFLVGLGIYIINKYEIISMFVVLVFGMYLIIHIFGWSIASFKYERFKIERDSFESTLKLGRDNSNFETATLIREIASYNKKLEVEKYKNTLFFLKDYVDDRVDQLKPIK